tara:strand:+ start:270 stop:524 length:255 start_codon:yes stop_codon:yes gene_type:complete
MSFKEKGLVTFKTTDGKHSEQVESETIITLTNMKTGYEYNSDAEGDADVRNPDTSTKKEHLKRDVVIDIKRTPAILSKSDLVKP